MYKTIDLQGLWNFQLDEAMQGVELPYEDTITLPGTTSYAKKGKPNDTAETGFLTDQYKFEGSAWFSREFTINEENSDKNGFLYLERTRITTVWIDGSEVGTQDSLSTPHVYDVTKYMSQGTHTLTIRVDNTGYPTKGGHLTSPDTQTNWNGLTGRIELQLYNQAYLSDVQIFPNIRKKTFTIHAKVLGTDQGLLSVSAASFNLAHEHKPEPMDVPVAPGDITVTYPMGEDALLWSEFEPNLYKLSLNLVLQGSIVDTQEIIVGLRDFQAQGDKFTINGTATFLRGKHDGLIFPLTGFAPTTVEEWFNVLSISKSYGINHYRFHTCCPPDAAFTAADLLGIYMQPELPFWGTITDDKDANHNQAEQDYLIREGFEMMRVFGNHPSFAMMSLGNELWGSQERINAILKSYKEVDSRHLYTQGSNNFQFVPVILEHDDFFSGVRFSRDRLIRGSYAMCDAPLGHIQTDKPSTMKDYDENISPTQSVDLLEFNAEGTIQIQFGTETKTVNASEGQELLIPNIPVISHEIGQYQTFPDFREIDKYTGPLKARNFELFKQRLEEKGLDHLAQLYFSASGKLAMECYKEELEAAFRSRKMAGFQLLDLQDFSGQGTALVGVLDAFMDSKGLISAKEWCSFCSDAVLLARFDKYNYTAGEAFHAQVELAYYRQVPLNNFKVLWKLTKDNGSVYKSGELHVSNPEDTNYLEIGEINIPMPNLESMTKLRFSLEIEGLDVEKTYDLWVYPAEVSLDKTGVNLFNHLSEEAVAQLEKGENVLLIPHLGDLANSIEGFYSSDFWCYPMFRSISESMNKEVPVGTMGLLIDNEHPVFKHFPCEEHSTYPWWSIVSNSRSIILDDTPRDFRPIVQTIDNFERNHKLGLLFECKIAKGNLLVLTCDMEQIIHTPEGKQLFSSILTYVNSEDFKPATTWSVSLLQSYFKQNDL
ncbi:sugar-binding domain-containing protein [Paenibacillus wynnii]|uniref:beta-galactosidase n=1 Tax=Paenibacillus wynnii TaxID=268407 RepID=A0A098MDY9_9BACL|nr:sugar-binding domain-containing protein [Paenibacillus wynnii]KGE19777.1 beta-glucuronidase [Paenibacillus wynnii]